MYNTKMDTIFMNSKNSGHHSHRLWLNLQIE